MNCALCNGTVLEKTGVYPFRSKTLGKVSVPDITYEECLECGDRSLSLQASTALREYVCQEEQAAIAELPASDLITATEATKILNMSKQAFSQNPKISKRGFIYYINVGGRKLYFKKSVEQYGRTGDGRFKLTISKMAWKKLLCINGTRKIKNKKKQATWEVDVHCGHQKKTSKAHQDNSSLVNNNAYTAEA